MNDRFRDLTGAWSLDALSDAERAEFEAYLLDDDDARAEATELADTAAMLGAAVTPEQPPAALKSRLLDAIEGLPQTEGERPAPAAVPALAAVPAEPAVEHRETVASRSTSAEGRVYRFTRRTAAMFALAAVLLVGITVGGIALRSVQDAGSQTTVSAIRAADDARTARATVAGGGSAELVWSASQHRSAITVDGVAPLRSGQTYQLWYIDGDGKAVSAGTFGRTDGAQTVVLTGRFSSGDTIGMTVEPKGGSDQPTTKPVVAIVTA